MRYLRWLIPLLAPVMLWSQNAPVDPKVAALFPEHGEYLTDLTGKVENGAAVTARLKAIREQDTLSLVAVVLPTIGNYDPNVVTLNIGRKWKVLYADSIGSDLRNTGGVILLVMDTHKCYVGVGRGSEGYMTDARSGAACRAATDSFRAGHFGAGVISIANTFREYHVHRNRVAVEQVKAQKPVEDTGWPIWLYIVLGAGIIGAIVVMVVVYRSNAAEEEAIRRQREAQENHERQLGMAEEARFRRIEASRQAVAALLAREQEEERWNALTPEERQAEKRATELRLKREADERKEAQKRQAEADRLRKISDEEDSARRRSSSYDSGSSSSSSSSSDSSNWSSGGSDSMGGGGGGSSW